MQKINAGGRDAMSHRLSNARLDVVLMNECFRDPHFQFGTHQNGGFEISATRGEFN